MGLISNGTTIFDAGAIDSGIAKGAMTFIKKLTASSSSTLSFVNGASSVVLDSTYNEYLFTFKNIHPATDNADFNFQTSTDGGSSYGVTVTNTYFSAYHNEGGNYTSLGYRTGADLAQSTNFIELGDEIGNENDQCFGATLHLFNPSSTTFAKHYLYRGSHTQGNGDYMVDIHAAGYFNTTSAINAIQFKFASGNIDAGDICLYGIS